jgi:hypothetical protein
MRAALIALSILAVLSLGACAAEQRTTSLRVAGAPLDASVTIDDRYLGSFAYVAKRGVALPPGTHRPSVST